MNKFLFSNSFSNFIFLKNNKNLILKNLIFNNFLKNIIILSNNYENIDSLLRLSLTTSLNILIKSCIFKNLDTNEQGGALFVNNLNINISLIYNSFINCTSRSNTYTAGGILIFSAKKNLYFGCCFYQCSSVNLPSSIQIVTHESTISNTEMNFTTELNAGQYKVISSYGSLIGGNNLFYFTNNNESHGYASTFHPGICFTVNKNEFIYYNQISNNIGNGFLWIGWQTTQFQINYINFINNTSKGNNWIISSSLLILNNCYFYNNPSTYFSTSNKCTINLCSFNNIQSLMNFGSNILNSNNNFEIIETYYFKVLTNNCWKNFTYIEISKKKKKKISFLFLLINLYN